MKSYLIDILVRRGLTVLAAPALALASGCAVASDPQAATPKDEPVAEESSALVSAATASATCEGAPLPPPRTCTLWKCSGDSWIPAPVAAGAPCVLTGGGIGACSGVAGQCDAVYTGTITPKFYVLSVQYAPPGAQSTVDYGTGTTWGTTLSTASSWSNAFKVSVSNKENLLGFGSGGLTVSAEWDQSGTTTDTYDIKETLTTDLENDGDADLVDHGLDRIYLWLSPEFDVSGYADVITWAPVAPTDPTPSGDPHVVWVSVDQLLGSATIDDGVQGALTKAGITPADYASILSVDPFANGGTTIDQNRFMPIETLDYEAPSLPAQKQLPSKVSLSTTTTSTWQHQAQTSYKVGADIKGSAGFLGLIKLGLDVSDTLTLTSTNTNTATNGTTATATASIMQPAYGYEGPVYLDVYVDTVYNTFLFQFEQPKFIIYHPIAAADAGTTLSAD